MLKSILPDWQVVYWVDCSHIPGATVEEISDSDFSDVSEETYAMSDDEALKAKEEEMNYLIDRKYPYELRMDYMTKWIIDTADTDFTDMKIYISGIKAAFAAGWKDTDFTDWQ